MTSPAVWAAQLALIALLTVTGPDSLLIVVLATLWARVLWRAVTSTNIKEES